MAALSALLLAALAAPALAQCSLPASLANYGPILSPFSGAGLALQPGGTALSGAVSTLLLAHPSRAAAFAVECLQALDANFVTSAAVVASSGPGSGAPLQRCTTLSIATDSNGVKSAALKTFAGKPLADCNSSLSFSTAPFSYSLQLSGATAFVPACSAAAPSRQSAAAMALVNFIGQAGGLLINITNSSILMPESASALGGAPGIYSVLTCVSDAVALADGSVKVSSFSANVCAYLLPTNSFLAATAWGACSHANFAAAASALSAQRFLGTFPYAAPPPASAVPPPPPAAATELTPVPTLNFATTLTFPSALSVDSFAASLLCPCSIAALRVSMAASLGVALNKVLLQSFTLSDSSVVVLDPSNAGNLAGGACSGAGACGAALRRELAAAAYGARVLQPSQSVQLSATVVQPSAATSAAIGSATISASVPGLGAATGGSVSGVTSGTATLPVPLAPIVRIKPYAPSSLILQFHAIPRGASTNIFSAANMDLDSIIKCGQALGAKDKCANNYIFGALAPGLALIVVGIVALVLWLLSYACACIRCCGFCKPRNRTGALDAKGRPPRCARVVKALPAARLVLGIINMGLIFGALSYTPLFPKGLVGISDLATSLVSTLGDTAALVTGQTPGPAYSIRLFDGSTSGPYFAPQPAVSAAAVDLSCLYSQTDPTSSPSDASCAYNSAFDACGTSPTGRCTASFVQNLLSGASSALSAASGAGMSGAGSAVTAAQGAITGSLGSLNLASVQALIVQAANTLFVVIALMCVVQALWVCRCYFACCMYKCLAPVSIIFCFLVFLLAGIFYLFAVLGSDVCAAPADTIITATGNMPQLTYYLSCATNPNLAPPDFLSAINGILSQITSGTTQLGKLVTSAATASSPAGYGPLIPISASSGAAPRLVNAQTNLNGAFAAISAIPNAVFSCQQVDALFSAFFNSLCNGTVTSAAGIAQCLIAAGVFMLLQMAIGIDICCYHPGDAKAWEDKGLQDGTNCCGCKRKAVRSG